MLSWVPNLAAFVLAASVLGLGAGEGAHDDVVLRLPDRDWGIRVAPPGFEFDTPLTSDDGSIVWAAGDATDLATIVKVRLESSAGVEDSSGCLARSEGRLGLDSQEVHRVVRSRQAGMPSIEYELRRHGSVRVDQLNLHAYRFHDGACAEFHLSMMNYKGQNRGPFDRVLRSIAIIEIGTDTPAANLEKNP